METLHNDLTIQKQGGWYIKLLYTYSYYNHTHMITCRKRQLSIGSKRIQRFWRTSLVLFYLDQYEDQPLRKFIS